MTSTTYNTMEEDNLGYYMGTQRCQETMKNLWVSYFDRIT